MTFVLLFGVYVCTMCCVVFCSFKRCNRDRYPPQPWKCVCVCVAMTSVWYLNSDYNRSLCDKWVNYFFHRLTKRLRFTWVSYKTKVHPISNSNVLRHSVWHRWCAADMHFFVFNEQFSIGFRSMERHTTGDKTNQTKQDRKAFESCLILFYFFVS